MGSTVGRNLVLAGGAAFLLGWTLLPATAHASYKLVVGVYTDTEVGDMFKPSPEGAALFRKIEVAMALKTSIGAHVTEATVYPGKGTDILVCGRAVNLDTRAPFTFIYKQAGDSGHVGPATHGLQEALGCFSAAPHYRLGIGPSYD